MNQNEDSLSTPYKLDNNNNNKNDQKTPPDRSSSHNIAISGGASLMIVLILWLTLGHTVVFVVLVCLFLVVGYHWATTSEMSPVRIYYQIAEAKEEIIREPRLYTQDDMALGEYGAPMRDWASATSGAYVELDGNNGNDNGNGNDSNAKEMQLVFASPVSRPVGRFWSKPKSLLWTLTGYGNDFTLQEGLISETGKCYWVEQHDFTDSGGRVLRLVQGTWDYETHEFAGSYVDSNGTMGSYPTLVKQK